MNTFNKSSWVGRKFLCKDTGETLTIPENVHAKCFYDFGECFVDVGDGYYARFGGDIEEITEED